MTGHWPYKDPGPFGSPEEMRKYQGRVDGLFGDKVFPSVEGIVAGGVIRRCWDG